jgi:hypothetical protein
MINLKTLQAFSIHKIVVYLRKRRNLNHVKNFNKNKTMKWILIFHICLFTIACCKKSEKDCASDEMNFGEINCIKKDGYTFYETDVNFYCLDRSILFGLDISKSEIAPYYINTLNPVNTEVMSNSAEINLTNCTYCGFNIECSIGGQSKVTWVIIEDKTQFTNYPSIIKAKLLLKESVDFNSKTLDSKDIELEKRQ